MLSRCRVCLTSLLLLFILLLGSVALAAELPGDANCDGVIDAADGLALAHALFAGSVCVGADANRDATLSAADLVAYAKVVGLLLTPTPTPTVTATVTRTATSTPTLLLCPNAADLEIKIDNQSGEPEASASISGRLVTATCRNPAGLDLIYDVTAGPGTTVVTHLAPGVWVHGLHVDTPSSGQKQFRRSLLLADGGPNRMTFTVMASAFTVRNPQDGSGSNTFRDALHEADAALKPFLIQFDDVTFPAGEEVSILLTSAVPPLAASSVTIDGFDADGLAGKRIIDANGRAIAGLSISGGFNTVTGLRIRNTGGSNRDVVSITGPQALGNVIEDCIIDTAATGDGIGIDDRSGSDLLDNANVVRTSEIFAASDKGIKVTKSSHARVERCWLHDNVNGGVQATLSGNVLARDNLIERSVGNASAQNGLSVNGVSPTTPDLPSQLTSDGNIARFNAGNGLSLRGYSVGTIENDYFAANGRDGIRLSSEDQSPTATVQGTTVACNAVNGATIEGAAQGDFGGGSQGSVGSNAFTQNNLPGGNENFLNLTSTAAFAINNQWEHCGTGATCTEDAVANYDISDHGRLTEFRPALAHRSGRAPAVTAVRPSRGVKGDLIRIIGSGFNAIDGHDAEQCADLTVRNRCAPLRGNCVRLGDVPATLEAVTPTMLVIRLPFSCVTPVALTVTTQGGGISAPALMCTNAVE